MREILHFPDRLDNADVLEFSNLGNWETIKGDDRIVRYFAICQYPGDSKYYLFFWKNLLIFVKKEYRSTEM